MTFPVQISSSVKHTSGGGKIPQRLAQLQPEAKRLKRKRNSHSESSGVTRIIELQQKLILYSQRLVRYADYLLECNDKNLCVLTTLEYNYQLLVDEYYEI